MTEYIKKELVCQKLKMIEEYERIKRKEGKGKYFRVLKRCANFTEYQRRHSTSG